MNDKYIKMSVHELMKANEFHTTYGNLKEGFYLIIARAFVYALLAIADALQNLNRNVR